MKRNSFCHRPRLQVNELPVKMISDHSVLSMLKIGKGLPSRMVRWKLKLAYYNVDIEHKAG